MMHRMKVGFALSAIAALGAACVQGMTDAELRSLRDGFEGRRDDMFAMLAGVPLRTAAKRPPLKPGRGAYTRHYSYSLTSFALRAFWLGEQLAEANRALAENCKYYIGNAPGRNDRDSFYWASDLITRTVEFFGARGSRRPGLLTAETERTVAQMMWLYCAEVSRRADADSAASGTWHVHESENHHLQRFMTTWHFSKLLAARPEYRERTYADGGTPAEHWHAWTEYAKEYFRERIRKGLFIEMANKGYGFITLKCIYDFHDFASDPELRRLAGAVLDLYWAAWAQEQLDGVRGGGASRVYPGPMSLSNSGDAIGRLAGFYLGNQALNRPSNNEFSPLTSPYRMPLVVMDLALDRDGRGVYEIRQRRMGLALPGFYRPPDYRLDSSGGLVRYSYCCPEFILGTALLPARPLEDWTMISSQNRWHGVVFSGHPDARIVPQCDTGKGNTYNQQWSVQSKGSLVVQRLPGSSGTGDMRVWLSGKGLGNRLERAGWVFVEAEGAFAAVRPVVGGYDWRPATGRIQGEWLHCRNRDSPVILEVARKSDYTDYATFADAVASRPLRFANSVLRYTGLGGDVLTFYADRSRPPEVNGIPVDYTPSRVFDSPFIRSEWNSGQVTVRKGTRVLRIRAAEDGP